MNKYQLIGGVALLVLAALIFLLSDGVSSTPVAISLTVIGIALAATSRRAR
jgi:uncharacterized membrane protein